MTLPKPRLAASRATKDVLQLLPVGGWVESGTISLAVFSDEGVWAARHLGANLKGSL